MSQQLDRTRYARFEDTDDGFGGATFERVYQRVRAEAGHQKSVMVPQEGKHIAEHVGRG